MFLCALLLAPPAPAQTPTGLAADWQQAVSLVQSGAPDQAIPILERLVTARPDAASVRLELGLAYFLTGDDGKARHHIRQALAGDLDAGERRGGETILRRIDARRTWSASFGAAIIPQSNAGRRTSDGTVMIGGLPFVLNQTAESGVGLSLNARVGWSPQLAEGVRGRFSLGIGGTIYEQSALNDYTLRAEAGAIRDFGQRDLGAGVLAARRWVGDSRYTDEVGVWASIGLRPSQTLRLGGRAELAERRAPGRPGLDAQLFRLTLGAEQVLSPRMAVHGRAFLTVTDARADHESGRMAGITLGVRHLFDGGWLGSLEATVSRELRDGPQPIFLITRRDTELRLAARLLNRQVQVHGFAPVLEVGHERRRSPLPLSAFSNTYVSIGIDRAF